MIQLAAIGRTIIPNARVQLLPDQRIAVALKGVHLVIVNEQSGVVEVCFKHEKVDALCRIICADMGIREANVAGTGLVQRSDPQVSIVEDDEDRPGF